MAIFTPHYIQVSSNAGPLAWNYLSAWPRNSGSKNEKMGLGILIAIATLISFKKLPCNLNRLEVKNAKFDNSKIGSEVPISFGASATDPGALLGPGRRRV
jgi:hypothetical protein